MRSQPQSPATRPPSTRAEFRPNCQREARLQREYGAVAPDRYWQIHRGRPESGVALTSSDILEMRENLLLTPNYPSEGSRDLHPACSQTRRGPLGSHMLEQWTLGSIYCLLDCGGDGRS